jgi:hypothetical protein
MDDADLQQCSEWQRSEGRKNRCLFVADASSSECPSGSKPTTDVRITGRNEGLHACEPHEPALRISQGQNSDAHVRVTGHRTSVFLLSESRLHKNLPCRRDSVEGDENSAAEVFVAPMGNELPHCHVEDCGYGRGMCQGDSLFSGKVGAYVAGGMTRDGVKATCLEGEEDGRTCTPSSHAQSRPTQVASIQQYEKSCDVGGCTKSSERTVQEWGASFAGHDDVCGADVKILGSSSKPASGVHLDWASLDKRINRILS